MRFNLIRKVIDFLVLGVLLFTSCLNEDLQITSPEEQPHTVGIYAGDVTTRTEMLEDGLSAVWVAGDKISLWAKNSAGNFTLSNQYFTTYGLEGGLGYFTSELDAPMPEGDYTYYACYPNPKSVNGTRVTFDIPAVQKGDAGAGADIMISDPVVGPELNSINNEQPYNKVSLTMNRLTHHLRFWIPKGENHLGEDINRIEITMPDNIVGTFYSDLSKPTEYKDLGSGSKTVAIELDEPLKESDFSSAQFAYAVIYPNGTEYTSADYMYITVYGNSGKSTLDPIPLEGRTFLPGHSTPVRLLPKEPAIYCSMKIRTGTNNVGEPLWNIKISLDGKTLFNYANTSSAYHNIEYLQEYHGASGKETFDELANAVLSGKAVLNFETAHASIDLPITAGMLTLDGNSGELDLGDVPYLLYEDFSNAGAYAMNDGYAASTNSDTGTSGYLLNGYLPNAGWNASRFGLIEGDCVRINCRYEGAVFAYRKYCGRLDTPAFKWIKPGTSVNVVIEYDKAFYIPAGYNLDTSAAKAKYYVGHHTKSESNTLGAIGIGNTSESNITGDSNIVFTSGLHASENVGNMSHHSVTIPSATNATRAVFYVNTTETKVVLLGMNSCYYLYLDNIKVYIKN